MKGARGHSCGLPWPCGLRCQGVPSARPRSRDFVTGRSPGAEQQETPATGDSVRMWPCRRTKQSLRWEDHRPAAGPGARHRRQVLREAGLMDVGRRRRRDTPHGHGSCVPHLPPSAPDAGASAARAQPAGRAGWELPPRPRPEARLRAGAPLGAAPSRLLLPRTSASCPHFMPLDLASP